MDCKICGFSNGKEKSFKIFEDDKVAAVLHPEPAGQGHIILFSKEHLPIIETVPDELIGHMFTVANDISKAVFDKLNAHGTNVLINNGLSAGQEFGHFTINIIPRWQNDGLNFDWTPKKLSEDEMSTIEVIIKDHTKDIGFQKEKASEVIEAGSEPQETISSNSENGEQNYLIKQLERLP